MTQGPHTCIAPWQSHGCTATSITCVVGELQSQTPKQRYCTADQGSKQHLSSDQICPFSSKSAHGRLAATSQHIG